MKNIYDLYEGLLSGEADTLAHGDKLIDNMSKLQWLFCVADRKAVHFEDPYNKDKAKVKQIIKDYFVKNGDLTNNIEMKLSYPGYKERGSKISLSPEYIAAYILDTKLNIDVDNDILKNTKKFNYVCDAIRSRLAEIMTPEGRNNIEVNFDKGSFGSVIMVRIYKLDGRRRHMLMMLELEKRQYKK